MTSMKKVLLAAVSCMAVSVPVSSEAYITSNDGCTTNENATVSVNFNGMDKDVTAVKQKLDAKISEIKELAGDQHFTKFDVQSNNYSINGNFNYGYGSEPQFQYNGSASFMIQPADKAVDFMVMLTKKGYQASVNVSSYKNGNCNQTLSR